jgi:hypothetical protein
MVIPSRRTQEFLARVSQAFTHWRAIPLKQPEVTSRTKDKKRLPDIRKDTQEALGVKAGALDNHPAIQTPKLHSWPQLDINPRS